jgi:invasion protein IalB
MKQPSKRAVYGLIAFFGISGLLFAGGAALSWSDEHGGVAGKARVTRCTSHHYNKTASVNCDATWAYNGRTVTGYVENAKKNQAGKTISVRIHGTSHVTNTTYWVPIGLGLFALLELGVGAMILVKFRRRSATAEP